MKSNKASSILLEKSINKYRCQLDLTQKSLTLHYSLLPKGAINCQTNQIKIQVIKVIRLRIEFDARNKGTLSNVV